MQVLGSDTQSNSFKKEKRNAEREEEIFKKASMVAFNGTGQDKTGMLAWSAVLRILRGG